MVEITKQKDLVAEINRMMKSEFLQKEHLDAIDSEIDKWITFLENLFGDNDGEPLEEDGIKFVTDLLKYRLMDYFSVLQE